MDKNKLYELSNQQAIEKLMDLLDKGEGEIVRFHETEIKQLTAEIYGMKLLEIARDSTVAYDFDKEIFEDYDNATIIGTTQQLHDHLVEQFNKENI